MFAYVGMCVSMFYPLVIAHSHVFVCVCVLNNVCYMFSLPSMCC